VYFLQGPEAEKEIGKEGENPRAFVISRNDGRDQHVQTCGISSQRYRAEGVGKKGNEKRYREIGELKGIGS